MGAYSTAEADRWQRILEQLQAEDLVEATRRARRRAMIRLEDQGIAALALFLSEVLARTLDWEREQKPSPPSGSSSSS